MGIFVCDKCNCVENTALGHFWARDLITYPGIPKGTALCSECMPPRAMDPRREYSKTIGKTPESYYARILGMEVSPVNKIELNSPMLWSVGDRISWELDSVAIFNTIKSIDGSILTTVDDVFGYDKRVFRPNNYSEIFNMTKVRSSDLSLHGGKWHGKFPKVQWDRKRDVMNRESSK